MKLERIQKRGLSDAERAEIEANKRALLSSEATPAGARIEPLSPAAPQPGAPQPAAPGPAAPTDRRDRTMERTTLYLPAYVAVQLRVKAASEKGTNISRLVLRALRSEGIEVEDRDLFDQRGRGSAG